MFAAFFVVFFLKQRILKMSRDEKGAVLFGTTGIMSEQFKEELAKELGFYDVVQKEGWGAIRAKDAGNMVKLAIQLAEQHLANKTKE